MKFRGSFEIEREIGGGRARTLKQSASVDLVLVNSQILYLAENSCSSQVELPTQLYLKYNGVEYRGDRNDVIVAKYVRLFSSSPTE